MVKVVFKTLTSRKVKPPPKKSVRTESGDIVTVRRLDGDSKSFADEFRYVFEKNVEKARRENKKPPRSTSRKG